MPLYEYKCSKCEKTFEVMQKFSDAPLTVHEECGGKVERLLSAPAFQLKGTGWYITDYARSGKGDKAEGGGNKGDGASTAESKSTDSSKSDSTKSETKSETKTSSDPGTTKSG